MAAPAWVDSKQGSATGTTITITAPASIVSGDTLVAIITCATGNPAWTTPSGWTAGPSTHNSYISTAVFHKVASSSEPASYSFVGSGASGKDKVGSVMQISGIASPTTVAGDGFAYKTGTGRLSWPRVATVPKTAMLLVVAVSTKTLTTPSGTTNQVRTSFGDTLMICTALQAAAGETPAYTTFTSAGTHAQGLLLALRAGSAAPSGVTVAGLLAASGTLAASLGAQVALAGAFGATGKLSANAAVNVAVSGALRAAGTLSGATGAEVAVAGSLAASGSLSGSVGAGLGVTGAFSASGTLSGTVDVSVPIAGPLRATGALSGAPTVSTSVSGSLVATGALTGTVGVGAVSVAGSPVAIGRLGATIIVTVPNVPLAGSLVGAGELSGHVTPSGELRNIGPRTPVRYVPMAHVVRKGNTGDVKPRQRQLVRRKWEH